VLSSELSRRICLDRGAQSSKVGFDFLAGPVVAFAYRRATGFDATAQELIVAGPTALLEVIANQIGHDLSHGAALSASARSLSRNSGSSCSSV
jgi:hypothetical protein